MLAPILVAPSVNPYHIYYAARQEWSNYSYPRHVRYTIVVDVVSANQRRVERYHATYNSSSGRVWVNTVSDWEKTHPSTGRGVGVFLVLFNRVSYRLNKPLPPVDFLGVPRLAPNYGFGMSTSIRTENILVDRWAMVKKIRAEYHDPAKQPFFTPSSPATPGKPLRLIATVAAFSPAYKITYAGEERASGHLCYHLKLMPFRSNRSPISNRLRDLWVGEKTFTTWKMRISANFISGAPSLVSWVISFRRVGNSQYIASEAAELPISRQGLIFTEAKISFEHIQVMLHPLHRPYFAPVHSLVLTEP